MVATIQERIKECRISSGLTLLQVANLLNIKEATVQRYESGDIKNIKHETVVQLANIFGCSPAYLMGWTDSFHEVIERITPPLNDEEILLIEAYRKQPSMRSAVNRLLGLDIEQGNVVQMPEKQERMVPVTVAAFGDDGSEPRVRMVPESDIYKADAEVQKAIDRRKAAERERKENIARARAYYEQKNAEKNKKKKRK